MHSPSSDGYGTARCVESQVSNGREGLFGGESSSLGIVPNPISDEKPAFVDRWNSLGSGLFLVDVTAERYSAFARICGLRKAGTNEKTEKIYRQEVAGAGFPNLVNRSTRQRTKA